jgi:hypothetical protein
MAGVAWMVRSAIAGAICLGGATFLWGWIKTVHAVGMGVPDALSPAIAKAELAALIGLVVGAALGMVFNRHN